MGITLNGHLVKTPTKLGNHNSNLHFQKFMSVQHFLFIFGRITLKKLSFGAKGTFIYLFFIFLTLKSK
jgi:hypothetical protein